MSREEGKHRDELFRVAPILKELGYTPNENMCGDAPDILIPSVEKRNIGIEVVSYSTGQNEKAQNALRKVLDEYADILDRKSDKRFEIGIGLLGSTICNNIKPFLNCRKCCNGAYSYGNVIQFQKRYCQRQ